MEMENSIHKETMHLLCTNIERLRWKAWCYTIPCRETTIKTFIKAWRPNNLQSFLILWSKQVESFISDLFEHQRIGTKNIHMKVCNNIEKNDNWVAKQLMLTFFSNCFLGGGCKSTYFIPIKFDVSKNKRLDIL